MARLAAVLVVLFAAAHARAQDARARLDYVREGAEGCPDLEALRDAASARLGYVPFDDAAPRTVRVHVRRSGRRFRASIEVVESGETTGARELGASGASDACPIEDALVLAVSLAIDPMTLARSEPEVAPVCPAVPEPTPCPECEVCPACAEPAACSTAVPAPSPLVEGRLGVLAELDLGPLPLPTAALRIVGGVQVEALSIDLELRGAIPTSGGDELGSVTATWLTAALAVCGHAGPVALCALTTDGVLVGWGGDVTRPLTDATFFAAAGGRAGIELPLDDTVLFVAAAALEAVLTPTDLTVDGRTLHTTPPVVGAISSGLAFRIQ